MILVIIIGSRPGCFNRTGNAGIWIPGAGGRLSLEQRAKTECIDAFALLAGFSLEV